MKTDQVKTPTERIETALQRLRAIGSEDCVSGYEELDAETAADFVEHIAGVEEYLSGAGKTLRERLLERDYAPPSPESLTDEQLAVELARFIDEANEAEFLIDAADHLSDRELYELLFNDCLDTPAPEGGTTTWSPIGGFGEEDIQVWLTYYADDEDRERWAKDFPEETIPPKREPPYPRHLPTF